jgi:hypothetical protein
MKSKKERNQLHSLVTAQRGYIFFVNARQTLGIPRIPRVFSFSYDIFERLIFETILRIRQSKK